MRQGQQNRRGRGRNNNHQQNRRGGQNPLTRSFESTGPDTKIRGTPAHIAEKYMTLARDAQSSGDPVLAENYLQHAEHYNRIIMAYREQMQQSGELNAGPQPSIARFRPGPQDPMGDDFGDGDGDEFGGDLQAQPSVGLGEPQPGAFDGGPRDNPREGQRFEDRGPRHEGQQHRQQHQHRDRSGGDRGFSNDRRDRQERFDRPDRQDRPERQDRPDRPERHDRNDRPEPRFERQPAVEAQPEAASQQRRGPRPIVPPAHEQPEFLRRPVRRPRREEEDSPAPAATTSGDDPTSE